MPNLIVTQEVKYFLEIGGDFKICQLLIIKKPQNDITMTNY